MLLLFVSQDEVLTISEKIVVRVHDLVTWLSPSLEWSWGREVACPMENNSVIIDDNKSSNDEKQSDEAKIDEDDSGNKESTIVEKENVQPQVLTDPCIDFTDVDKRETSEHHQQEANVNNGCWVAPKQEPKDEQAKVVVLSYARYCRYRALVRRLENAKPSWLSSSLAAAMGGFTAMPGTRVLFCRDTFDYPDLETHELLCNHLGEIYIYIIFFSLKRIKF